MMKLEILTITEEGYGKRTKLFRIQTYILEEEKELSMQNLIIKTGKIVDVKIVTEMMKLCLLRQKEH